MLPTKPLLLLAAICAINAVSVWPEHIPTPDLNDNVLHLTLINGMVHAIERHDNPFTFWSPEIGLGQPVVRYYQPGSHAIVAAAYFALGKSVPIPTVFHWLKFLSLALVPLSFFFLARLIGLPLVAQLAAAALAPLVSGDAFGLDYSSYVWAGHGLFPQAVATHFLLLAIGFAWRSIRLGKTWIVPGLLLALTGWTNLLYGYVGAVTLLIVALIPGGERYAPFTRQRICQLRTSERFFQLAKVGLVGGLCAIPKLLAWLSNPSVTAMREVEGGPRAFMTDSFGAGQVLSNLLTGELLDHKRWPMITILAVLGIALALWRKSVEGKFLLAGFVTWLLLYFGRPFWGDLLPLAGIVPAFQLHRLIGPVQIFSVLLAASAIAAVWQQFRGHTVTLLIGAVIFLAPAIQQWRTYLSDNGRYVAIVRAGFAQDGPDIERALSLAKQRGGRAYAGLPGTWGPKFSISQVPIYDLFPVRGIPAVGLLYICFRPEGLKMYEFRDTEPEDYRSFDVRTVIRDAGDPPLPHTELIASFGRFAVYRPSSN